MATRTSKLLNAVRGAYAGFRAGYSGADITRTTRHWRPKLRSADQEVSGRYTNLLARALWLDRNEPVCGGARQTIVDNVVGMGIKCRANIKSARGVLQETLNQRSDEFYLRWMEEADARGRKHWHEMERVHLSDTIVQGNDLLVQSFNPDPRRVSPVQFELVEPHQLDRARDRVGTSSANEIRNGIEYDILGRAVTYYLYTDRPQTTGLRFSASEPVPASRVVHHYRCDRGEQTFGVTWYRRIIGKVFAADEYVNDEIDAAKNAAKFVAALKTEEGEGMGLSTDSDGDTVDANGNPFEFVGSSMLLPMGINESVELLQNPRPNSGGEAFLKHMFLLMGLGMHISYYRISGDAMQASFSALRAEDLKDQKYFKPVQAWEMRYVSKPVHDRVMDDAFAMGRISGGPTASQYLKDRHRFLACELCPPGWDFIDRDKLIRAGIRSVKFGFESHQDVVSGTGRDWRKVVDDRAEWEAYVISRGLDPDKFLGEDPDDESNPEIPDA